MLVPCFQPFAKIVISYRGLGAKNRHGNSPFCDRRSFRLPRNDKLHNEGMALRKSMVSGTKYRESFFQSQSTRNKICIRT